MKTLSEQTYATPITGSSLFSGDKVEIIGEQTVEFEGRTLERYLYNIEGYTPENGLPFVSLKANIIIEGWNN